MGSAGCRPLRYFAHRPVDVTLVDRRNHHLFQPLLYQVATGMLSPGQIAPPLRHIVRRWKNIRVELAEVTGFDLDRRIVHATTAANLRPLELPYDSLIVAAGVNQSYFGHDELARYAPGMKTIDDALELRRRIFGAFEMAEVTADPAERERWLTVVIVGAGPTGVELAGQVRELAVRCLKGEFRTFDPASVRVLLLDGGKEPLATFGDRLSGKATKQLRAARRRAADERQGRRGRRLRCRRARRRRRARRGSTPTRRSGQPGSRRRRSPPSSPRRAAPRSTAPAASRCCPTSRSPAIPRCSPSVTWRR